MLYWLPSLIRQWWLALVTASTAVWICLAQKIPPLWIIPAGLLAAALPFWRYFAPLWQFGKSTWRFQTQTGELVVVRHAPELEGAFEVTNCLQRAEEVVAEFHRLFGVALKRRLVIFLFPSTATVSRLFKTPVAGCALVGADAILLAKDGLWATMAEVLRHEVAHLFSARLGKLDQALNSEGLATWLMSSVDGRPIDFHALAYLLTDRCLFMTWLKDRAWFYSGKGSYLLAGSFTGYLIRRFGWECYRDFFRHANIKNFDASFTKTFEVSLLTAERQWRDDLLQRRHAFEPDLTRFMGEHSVAAAYNAGHVYRCLEESETLCRAGQASGKVLCYAALTHAFLGHYDQAAGLLEQAIQTEDDWVRSYRSGWLLQLGNLYDMLGQRDKALSAYRRTLAEPDDWSWHYSTHTRARLYRGRPFTEADLQKQLRLPAARASRQQT